MGTTGMKFRRPPKMLPAAPIDPLVHGLAIHMSLTDTATMDAAAKSGMSRSAIEDWVKGRRVPTLSNFKAVCEAVGLDIVLVGKDS